MIKSSSNGLTSNCCLQVIGDNRNKTSDTARSLLRFSVSVSVTVDLYNTGKRLQNHRNIGNALVHAIGDNGSTHTHRDRQTDRERERRIQTRTHWGHKTAESRVQYMPHATQDVDDSLACRPDRSLAVLYRDQNTDIPATSRRHYARPVTWLSDDHVTRKLQ